MPEEQKNSGYLLSTLISHIYVVLVGSVKYKKYEFIRFHLPMVLHWILVSATKAYPEGFEVLPILEILDIPGSVDVPKLKVNNSYTLHSIQNN